jgi:hypothetical protein
MKMIFLKKISKSLDKGLQVAMRSMIRARKQVGAKSCLAAGGYFRINSSKKWMAVQMPR